MGEQAIATKPCTVCGIDCAGRARVKDNKGRYFCEHCFEVTKQTKQIQTSPPPPPPLLVPDVQADNSFLLDIPSAPLAAPEVHRCPECGRPLPVSAKLCVGCGYDVASGKRLNVKVAKARAADAPDAQSTPSAGGSFPLAVIGAGIGAALGAVLWTVVVYLTGWEVGYVAWAVGGLAGGGALLGSRGTAGDLTGVVAAAFALVAIAAGKYYSVTMWLHAHHRTDIPWTASLSFFDLLWLFFALGTAWRVGSARRE